MDAVVAAAVGVAGVTFGDTLRGTWRHGPALAWPGRGTRRHRPSLCVAGVDLHFAWQAWHLWHWAASGGTLGSQWMPCVAAAVGVAGVALGDIDLHFAWQAWHLATWTCTLRGRCGTWRHSSSLCLAWRGIWPVDAVVAAAIGVAGVTLRGRRGTWRHGLSPCLAGVALMALGCLWWHAWFPVDAVVAAAVGVAGVALGGHRPSLCVAGVALGDMDLHLCMAGVALGDIDLHFARQALHFRAMDLHFAWQVWHLETWTFTLPGRHGTYGTGLPRMSAWFPFDAVVAAGCWRGRRGTW